MTRPPHFALRRLYGRAAAAARAIQQMRCHKAGLAALTAGVEGLEILSEKRIGRLVEGMSLARLEGPLGRGVSRTARPVRPVTRRSPRESGGTVTNLRVSARPPDLAAVAEAAQVKELLESYTPAGMEGRGSAAARLTPASRRGWGATEGARRTFRLEVEGADSALSPEVQRSSRSSARGGGRLSPEAARRRLERVSGRLPGADPWGQIVVRRRETPRVRAMLDEVASRQALGRGSLDAVGSGFGQTGPWERSAGKQPETAGVQASLDKSASGVRAARLRTSAVVRGREARGGESSLLESTRGQLAARLERIAAPRLSRSAAASKVRPLASRGPDVSDVDAPRPTPRGAEPATGLRGLAQRFAQPPAIEAPRTAGSWSGLVDAPAGMRARRLPSVPGPRPSALGDEDLAARLNEILRREALRHGIDPDEAAL